MRLAIIVFATLATLIMLCAPASAATLEWEQWVRIDPSDDMTYNETFNASASNSTDWTNYNATIIPFMNDTNISGTFTGSYLPPVVYELNDQLTWSTVIGSVVRFKSEWVMSGSSVSWWRCPALNLTGWSTFYLKIWRLESPGWLNIEWPPAGPNGASRPFKVYETWYAGATRNETWISHDVNAWDRNWTFIYNKVEAPIHSDTTYFAQWTILGGNLTEEGGQHILMSQSDVGDDGRYYTNTYSGEGIDLEADLDISVVHQYGMGHTVSGFQLKLRGTEEGGGDTYYPSGRDDMTEDLHPSGTEDGGKWDGDWVTTGSGLAIDAVLKTLGSYSIKSTLLTTNHIQYTYDTHLDVTVYDYSRVWVRSTGTLVRIWFWFTGGYYYKDVAVSASTWTEFEADMDDWSGWTQSGTPDLTNMERLIIYNSYGSTVQMNADEFYFLTGGGGGGGGSSVSINFYSNITEGPDSGSDYVTFFMPLIYDVNLANAACVIITEAVSGFSWTFYVDIQQDFILNSTVWPYPGVEGNQFFVNVTFQNSTNAFYIHDHNAINIPNYDDTLATHKNRFKVYGADNLTDGHQIHFIPFHSLQVTNGSWVNTQIDPLYFYDGRFVNISDYKMREQEHSDPIWYRIYIGFRQFQFKTYTIVDKVFFDDLLPDFDVTIQEFTYQQYANDGLRIGGGAILFAVVTFFNDVYEWILEYGPAVLTFIVKGIALIIGVPVWIGAVLVVNSVKRYFVIFAADGPEVGGEYAAHLVRNSFKRLPLPDIDRTTHIERVNVRSEKIKSNRTRRAAAKGAYYRTRNYEKVNSSESTWDKRRAKMKYERTQRKLKGAK